MFFFIVFRRLRIFLNQKPNMATFEGEGVCMSLTRKNPALLQRYADHLRSGHLHMKDGEFTEWNEKSYFRFLVF